MSDDPSGRIVLADEHALVRDGLRRTLEADDRLVIVAEASTGPELVEAMRAGHADLLISDVTLPGATGLQAFRSLKSLSLDVPTIFLTSSTKECHLREALDLGARAYLHKSVDADEFRQACRRVLRGERLLDADAAATLLHRWCSTDTALTAREREVVMLVADGLVNDVIAERLYLSVKTVERHRSNILTKLGLHSGVDLCRYAIRTGLVDA